MNDMEAKKAQLLKLMNDPTIEEETERPIFKMKLDEYKAFLERNADIKVRLWRSSNGHVFYFGLPSFTHDAIGASVGAQILKYFYKDLRVSTLPFIMFSSPTIAIGQSVKEPDFAFTPRNRAARLADGHRNPFPTMVCEVSINNENFETLKKELEMWTSKESDTILAIGFKVFKQTKDGQRRMKCLLKRKNEEIEEIEFTEGTPSLDQIFLIQLPCRHILNKNMPLKSI